MTSALDLLVQRLFDYSGMFPPEDKSFSDALSDSAKFPATLKRVNIVNADIVLSFNMLMEINESTLKECNFNRPCHIAVLGSSPHSETPELTKFCSVGEDSTVSYKVISYEIKGECDLSEALKTLPPYILLAIEPDLSSSDWKDKLELSCELISKFRDRVSLKIRGTGSTGIDNEKIVAVLREISRHKLHLKATGGLHHPIIEDRYKNNLGFLNLSIALLLARKYTDKISDANLLKCLNTSNAGDFTFNQDSLSWREFNISRSELLELKTKYKFSIGSCSLKEPDEDLVRLYR